MKFKKLISDIHLWAGLILGIQVLLWMASGVIMSWFHIKDVRGENASADIEPPAISAETDIVPLADVLAARDGAKIITLSHRPAGLQYIVEYGEDDREVFDALTGKPVESLDEEIIHQSALADFTGEGELQSVTYLLETEQEFRRDPPVWLAQFDDSRHTRLYIDPQTGDILSRRNDMWRIFDFFWMLHIMDYDERTNFNSWWLRGFAAAGLIFALSGLTMVYFRIRSGRYFRRRPKKG